ncbi:MAG: cation:proton antiporter [Thermoanaerobaculia bacterium]|nr:cation:proton antiporter [Thermoanaerobaculia bacterium]
MPDLLTVLALIGGVLIISALLSGLVERAPISFPILFLGLGALLGERGAGLLVIGPHDRTLEGVAVVTLALVLFLDAVRMRFGELRKDWFVPSLVLGPGTLLVILFVAGTAILLLGMTPLYALLLGAILASTDPVVLRDVLRDDRLPRSIRQTLSVESGTNDLVVLPIVLLLIAVAKAEVSGPVSWGWFLVRLLVLTPLVGFAIGAAGAWLMTKADARYGVRREYQALYGVGLVLASYVAGVAIDGDGFLAAFAAGASIAILNLKLCDCFLEFGDTTAEMAMFVAFVLFGAVLSSLIPTVPLLPTLLLAAVAVGIARPLAIFLVLRHATISRSARLFIGWFGPRGLNSLLLALLVVREGVPGGEGILAVAGLVVVVSVLAHGISASPLASAYAARVEHETLAEERESSAAGLLGAGKGGKVVKISARELADRLQGTDPPIVLDVRSRSSRASNPDEIPGSVHVLPDHLEEWAAKQSPDRSVVAWCT